MNKNLYNLCHCGSKKYNGAKQCQRCYLTSLKGEGNPMFGKKRVDMRIRIKEKNYNWRGGKPRCKVCKRELSNYNNKYCKQHSQLGKLNHTYKKYGSKRINCGYLFIKLKNKWMSEHRYIVEKYIGRKLKKTEIIHHIDGNGLNNKLNNLYIFTSIYSHHCLETLIKRNIIGRFVIKSNLKDFKKGG